MALTFLLDPLYCPEEHSELDADASLPSHLPVSAAEVGTELPEDWAEILSSLVAKEGETHPTLSSDGADDLYLRSARRGAVEWVVRAVARHGFSALTAVLAVNYLDRCFLSGGGRLRLQGDRPWMGRLSAVACLSLAAKVEETYVPLLLDLQAAAVEAEADGEVEAGYVFETKTVRRMELLVLSALGWRMNPVTPLSLIHLLLPRLLYKPQNGTLTPSSALLRCEAILLSVIADGRWVRYPASAWAAAAMRHVFDQQLEPGIGAAAGDALECHETHHLLAFLNAPKVEECFQLILDCTGGNGGVIGHGRKRRNLFSSLDYHPSPPSPNAVLGSCFSCESLSSCDSRAMWPFSSASSSPELPPPKRPNRIATEAFGDDEDGENGDRLHHHQEPRLDCCSAPPL
ncbi:cyclin-D3-2-like [Phoenix dactylifera]|uniref:Cyclin-D3-2-like n=1 Tax=Phoenix dactylifera TaxID=42345 RepID=A0A8B8J8H8_PHODC|nr:cyclin-D3-2-like [Phoenix dactylifera]